MTMHNPFTFSNDNKRYHTLAYHNRQIFGCRVFKATLDSGCTCPNIDGTKGHGGCSYCTQASSKTSALPIGSQLTRELHRIQYKHPGAPVIAYFQNGSGTHGSMERLETACKEVLSYDNVAGISIATRGDCITRDTCSFLWMLSKMTHLTIELGLQSIHQQTSNALNRAMNMDEFKEGFYLLKERDIRTCIHLINSLPGETPEMMMETAYMVGLLRPGAVKIHMLHLLEGTALGEQYKAKPFPLMSREEYVDIVVNQLEVLPDDVVIERLTGDGNKDMLIGPDWTRDKLKTLVEIDKRQLELDSYQGKRFL